MVHSDDDILRRVQQGDKSSYLDLFDRHYARIENYARRQLQNAEAARDVASETFLRAYRNVDSFRIGEGITYVAYLLMICHRLTLTELARQRANPTRSLEENAAVVERLADVDPSPADRLLESERKAMLKLALDCLPPDDREIIHLAFERDLSRRDIVSIMGKPSVSAVTSHLHRAMQKLKAIVVRQGYFRTEQEPGRK